MPDIIQQVQKRMLISLAQIAKQVGLKEGDHVLIEEKEGGVFIRPVAWHEKSQEYFWSEEWQAKMKRSKEAMDKGQYETFDKVDDLLKDLGIDEDEKDAQAGSNGSL
jgi:hypothetical protein